MTDIDNVNLCLSAYQDPTEQLNCIRAALGYSPVAATTATEKSSAVDYLILAGVAVALYILTTKK